ncbi:MAG: hypothetical protein GF317_10150 [Candidatus Lokiarchaeota archaeon]|nr:hypothetical protein [Candidatus Lokiarchaeota archaeon]MBD3200021.1 hypothetical protein [Candidatus Lokiarchaeota archaeon]
MEETFSDWDESEEIKLKILEKTLTFIYHFAMFKEIVPFMGSVFICVKKTLEYKVDTLKDFEQLLIKNALMRFIQEYITYSKLSQKEKVLDFLTASLGKLQLQPLIINLGLLLKPMYEDEEYIKKIKDYEEVEVTYILNSEEEVDIKKAIDQWLETQHVSLDNQTQLKSDLEVKFNQLINGCGLSSDSDHCKTLWTEVVEMMNMKLTVLSLMESIPEEEKFAPIKINNN